MTRATAQRSTPLNASGLAGIREAEFRGGFNGPSNAVRGRLVSVI